MWSALSGPLSRSARRGHPHCPSVLGHRELWPITRIAFGPEPAHLLTGMLVATKDGAFPLVQADLPQENSSVDQKRMREDLEGNHMVSGLAAPSTTQRHAIVQPQVLLCLCDGTLSRCSALLVQLLFFGMHPIHCACNSCQT